MGSEVTLTGEFVLSVPLAEAIDRLGSGDRARILTLVGFDRHFLRDVVSQLVEGVAGEDGDYWFGDDFYTELRGRLADQMPTVARELVRGLAQERDAALQDSRRESDWAWALFHAWPVEYRHLIPTRPSWTPAPIVSDEQADAMLAAREATP